MENESIPLTTDLVDVLEAYILNGRIREAAKYMGVKQGYVRYRVTILARLGLIIRKRGGRYARSDKTYYIMEDIDINELLDSHKKVDVEISSAEREWMMKNYIKYRRRRRVAAKLLGRTVYDINLMAIALELDRG